MIKIFRIMLLTSFAFTLPSFAQQSGNPCGCSITYENNNQVDPSPFSIRVIAGRAISEVGGPAEEIGPLPGACLGLFTAQDHRLVATTVTNEEGRFQFDRVQVGEYRLVVRAAGHCVANVPLRIIRPTRVGTRQRRQIVLHMRPASIDTCSYGSYR